MAGALAAPLWPPVLRVASRGDRSRPRLAASAAGADTCARGDVGRRVRIVLGAAGDRGRVGWLSAQELAVAAGRSVAGRRGTAVTPLQRPDAVHGVVLCQPAGDPVPLVPAARESHLQAPQGLFPDAGEFRIATRRTCFAITCSGPCSWSVVWAASKLRWLQHGRIQLYVLYIALTILVLTDLETGLRMLAPSGLVQMALALVLAPLLLSIINRTKAVFAGPARPALAAAVLGTGETAAQIGGVQPHDDAGVRGGADRRRARQCCWPCAFVPLAGAPALVSFPGDFLLVAYLLGLARFCHGVGGLGHRIEFRRHGREPRGLFFSALAEPALLLAADDAGRASRTQPSLTEIYARLGPGGARLRGGPAVLLAPPR